MRLRLRVLCNAEGVMVRHQRRHGADYHAGVWKDMR
jgi:hypothetical protein